MVEACADWSKPFHVIVTRAAITRRLGNGRLITARPELRSFYSGHDDEDEARELAALQNSRAQNENDTSTPIDAQYLVAARPEKQPWNHTGALDTHLKDDAPRAREE